MSGLYVIEINKWKKVDRVDFAVTSDTSIVKVFSLSGTEYLGFVDEFKKYGFEKKAKSDWSAQNECTIDAVTDGNTKITCKNLTTGKESQRSVPVSIEHYTTQVIMTLMQANEEVSALSTNP